MVADELPTTLPAFLMLSTVPTTFNSSPNAIYKPGVGIN